MFTDAQAMDAISRLEDDQQPVTIRISKINGLMLLSILQLALRHPQMPEDAARVAMEIARGLQEGICAKDPVLAELSAQGWDPEHDR